MNPFPALTAPHPLIFYLGLSDIDELALDELNLDKTSLAKGTAMSNNAFFV